MCIRDRNGGGRDQRHGARLADIAREEIALALDRSNGHVDFGLGEDLRIGFGDADCQRFRGQTGSFHFAREQERNLAIGANHDVAAHLRLTPNPNGQPIASANDVGLWINRSGDGDDGQIVLCLLYTSRCV